MKYILLLLLIIGVSCQINKQDFYSIIDNIFNETSNEWVVFNDIVYKNKTYTFVFCKDVNLIYNDHCTEAISVTTLYDKMNKHIMTFNSSTRVFIAFNKTSICNFDFEDPDLEFVYSSDKVLIRLFKFIILFAIKNVIICIGWYVHVIIKIIGLFANAKLLNLPIFTHLLALYILYRILKSIFMALYCRHE
jgi:hypothetical protein